MLLPLGWHFANLLTGFTILIAFISIIISLIKTIQYRKNRNQQKIALIYLFYFSMSLLTPITDFIAMNGVLFIDESQSTLNLLQMAVNLGALLAMIAFFVLNIAVIIELLGDQQKETAIYKLSILLLIYGIITIIASLFLKVNITGFQNYVPIYTYEPSLIFFGIIMSYSIIVSLLYGYISIRNYILLEREQKHRHPLHIPFVLFAGLNFLIITVSMVLWVIINPDAQTMIFLSSVIIFSMSLFPIFRWTYIERYNKYLLKYQRDNLMDMIQHDFANLLQIIMSIAESSQFTNIKPDEEIDLLIKQVNRLADLTAKARTIAQDGMESFP